MTKTNGKGIGVGVITQPQYQDWVYSIRSMLRVKNGAIKANIAKIHPKYVRKLGSYERINILDFLEREVDSPTPPESDASTKEEQDDYLGLEYQFELMRNEVMQTMRENIPEKFHKMNPLTITDSEDELKPLKLWKRIRDTYTRGNANDVAEAIQQFMAGSKESTAESIRHYGEDIIKRANLANAELGVFMKLPNETKFFAERDDTSVNRRNWKRTHQIPTVSKY
jgi:hypothetical protein